MDPKSPIEFSLAKRTLRLDYLVEKFEIFIFDSISFLLAPIEVQAHLSWHRLLRSFVSMREWHVKATKTLVPWPEMNLFHALNNLLVLVDNALFFNMAQVVLID